MEIKDIRHSLEDCFLTISYKILRTSLKKFEIQDKAHTDQHQHCQMQILEGKKIQGKAFCNKSYALEMYPFIR